MFLPLKRCKSAIFKQNIWIQLKSWRSYLGDPTNLKSFTVKFKVSMLEGLMTIINDKRTFGSVTDYWKLSCQCESLKTTLCAKEQQVDVMKQMNRSNKHNRQETGNKWGRKRGKVNGTKIHYFILNGNNNINLIN